MNIKVYHIKLKKNEPFIFYTRSGKLTNITNKKYPKPYTGRSLWNKNNIWTQINNPNFMIQTISIPAWLVKTEELEESAMSQLPAFSDIFCQEDHKDFNLFFVTKEWQDGYTELGMCAYNAIGSKRNIKIEKMLNKYIKFKVFS